MKHSVNHGEQANLPEDGNVTAAWLAPLLSLLKVKADDTVEQCYQKADAVANHLAPHTRRLYNFILVFQGLAVLAPSLWLIILREQLNVSIAAYSVVFCTIGLLVISWWMRWRGMQRLWVRARLVAEIARSRIATEGIDGNLTFAALRRSPMLQTVAQALPSSPQSSVLDVQTVKRNYVLNRLNDQLSYYHQKRHDALNQRQQLSKVVTLSLDAALFLAVAGVAIAWRDEAAVWLNWSYSDYVFGFVGTLLPLLAVLAQMRGAQLELNRRIGTFAQQIELLSAAKQNLEATIDAKQIQQIVEDVEASLLAEVTEWFYQAEHNEPYYRANRDKAELKEWQAAAVLRQSMLARLLGTLEYSAGFIGRVVLGRVVVVALSMVLTTAFIQYKRAPEDPAIQSVLRQQDGRLFSARGEGNPYGLWQQGQLAAQNGTVVLVHGLHDGVDKSRSKGHWMTRLETAIALRTAPQAPDIVLVDWQEAAKPSGNADSALDTLALNAMGMPQAAQDMLNDLSMIRPQGERIGELVGFKLARAIRNGAISRDKPLHLIGHSAGGFVVLHAALVLSELGLAPEPMQVTMLDTPFPLAADLAKAASHFPVDFYVTSLLAQGVPADQFVVGFNRFDITPPPEIDPYTGAHSYAHSWFIQSVSDKGNAEGFSGSPLLIE